MRDEGHVVTEIDNIHASALRLGDKLISVGGVVVVNRWHAKWLTTNLLTTTPKEVVVERSGEQLSFQITPHKSHHPLFALLNLMLGITFIVVGVMVGWGERSDPVSRAFYRLTCVAGCSVLFFSPANAWHPVILQYFQAFVRICVYTMISPLLVDFLLRFTGWPLRRRAQHVLYAAIILLAALLVVLYYLAESSGNPEAIARFEWTDVVLVGIIMALAFVISFGAVIYAFVTSKDAAHRHNMGWLLLVTAVGLIPYFTCHRIPMALGYAPFLPEWTIFGLMLIVPIGWGMAVASFRMLNVEWALSRTIIYVVAVILAAYVVLTFVLIIGKQVPMIQELSLKSQVIAGALLLVISALSLSSPVSWIIDRLYYQDWFNEQEAVRLLGEDLSKALMESELIAILTVKLPEILKVQSVALVNGEIENLKLAEQTPNGDSVRNSEILAIVRSALHGDKITTGKLSTNVVPEELVKYGFDLLLPLARRGDSVGSLLIGRKKSGAVFSQKDMVVLNALSNYTASALINITLTRQLVDQEKRALAVDMAGGIAHEINNSLFPLMGQAQLTEMKLRSNEFTNSSAILPALDIMIQMSERIRRIASNLSRLSQPPRLEPERLTLESVAEDALVILRETAGRIKYFSETDPDAPFKLKRELSKEGTLIWGDRQQLGQIYLNLIVNAADAIEERGSGTITVGVRADDNRQGVIGYVADDGPGIPPEIQDRILQPYFTTKAKGKGTGLGLAIVKQIVELHRGSLKLVSATGAGARFEFFIPSDSSDG